MTIDERLDRLTERHEALTQTVELLAADTSRQRKLMDDVLLSLARLATIAGAHEQRISNLEGD